KVKNEVSQETSADFSIYTTIEDGGDDKINSNTLTGSFTALAPVASYINLSLNNNITEIGADWQEFTITVNTNTTDFSQIDFYFALGAAYASEEEVNPDFNAFDLEFNPAGEVYPTSDWVSVKLNEINASNKRMLTRTAIHMSTKFVWELPKTTSNGAFTFEKAFGEWKDGTELRFRIKANEVLEKDRNFSLTMGVTHYSADATPVVTNSSNETGLTVTAKRYNSINLSWENELPETVSSTEWTQFGVKINTSIQLTNNTPWVSPYWRLGTDFNDGATVPTNLGMLKYVNATKDIAFSGGTLTFNGTNFNSDLLYMEYYDTVNSEWKAFTLNSNDPNLKNALAEENGNYIWLELADKLLQFRIKSKTETDLPVSLDISADYRPYVSSNVWQFQKYGSRNTITSKDGSGGNDKIHGGSLKVPSSTLSKSFTAKATVITAPSVEIIAQPKCDDEYAGVVKVTARGPLKDSYTWELWLNGDTVQVGTSSQKEWNIDQLVAGYYKIIITKVNGEQIKPEEQKFLLTVSDVVALGVSVDAGKTVQPKCEDGLNPSGSLTFTPAGGTGNNYHYVLWLNGAIVGEQDNDGKFIGLVAGKYKLVLTDPDCASLAPAEVEVTLSIPDSTPWKVLVSKTEPTCANNDGRIELDVTGGSFNPDIKYKWSNDSTKYFIDELAAGDYTVTIYDENCSAIEPYVLTVSLAKDANLLEIKIDEKIDPTCPGGSDGIIRVSVIGGNVGTYTYEWTGPDGYTADTEDISALKAGLYSLKVTASGDNNSCFAIVDNIELKDPFAWTKETIKDYINLFGQDLRYQNGYNVPAIRLLTNDLPEGSYISWEAIPVNNDSIGIAKGGDGEIPGFEAYNPKVAGESQVTIRVTIWNSSCEENRYSGSFTITITSNTIIDLDLVAKPVQSQSVCPDKRFTAIQFEAERTDGAPLGTVSYFVEFVSGVDVLNAGQTGIDVTDGNGLWEINLIEPSDRLTGIGTYKVTPRSENGQGISVTFTLEVLAAPQVDAVSDKIYCNGTDYFQTFTSSRNLGTTFDYEVLGGSQLGIPSTGSTRIEVRLKNDGDVPVTDSIVVTPHLLGVCSESGIRDTFTVTVLPTPKVMTIPNRIAANGSTLSAIDLFSTGVTDGTSSVATNFRWATDNPSIASNQTEVNAISSGEGVEFPSFTVKNTTDQPVIAKVTVTPVYAYNTGGSDYICEGESKDFYILVASRPVISEIENLTVCEGEQVAPVSTTGLPAGAGYFVTWEGGESAGLADYSILDAAADNYPSVRSIKNFTSRIEPGKEYDTTKVTVKVTPYLYFNSTEFAGDAKYFDINVIPQTKAESGYGEEVPEENLEFCHGEPVSIDVRHSQGLGLTYQWYKNHTVIPGATGSSYEISEKNSDNSASGKYYCVVTGACGSFISKTYNILIKLDILIQRWNDVLAVNCRPEINGGFTFSDFQWYVEDTVNGDKKLFGETKSYIQITEGLTDDALNARYYAVAKALKDGITTEYRTCPKAIIVTEESVIKLYPNPVKAGENVTVNVPGPAVIHLVDYSGVIVKTVTTGGTTDIQMPNKAGIYIVRVILEDQTTKEFKVIVK
ncbi:MAG: T9SS type A sorting domain-containing protein, partial [Dysgonamonadaceae bacterium]|nr:T9SS type A sorting domain-containing protein [Dysgonamonadaceae bacterium]